MKLKKQVKIVIVLILLGGIGFGFYSFNHWFFSKYKTKDTNIEEKNKDQRNGKEILEENHKEMDSANNTNHQSATNENSTQDRRKRASEIYYCSEGDTLAGKECITKIQTDALKVKPVDNRDYYELTFSFDTLASLYGLEEQAVIDVLKETCEKEMKGVFERSTTNQKQGSCIFTDMPEDNTLQYVCLDASYTLKGNKCSREERIPAKVRYGCPDGYVLDGIYCQEK